MAWLREVPKGKGITANDAVLSIKLESFFVLQTLARVPVLLPSLMLPKHLSASERKRAQACPSFAGIFSPTLSIPKEIPESGKGTWGRLHGQGRAEGDAGLTQVPQCCAQWSSMTRIAHGPLPV